MDGLLLSEEEDGADVDHGEDDHVEAEFVTEDAEEHQEDDDKVDRVSDSL